MIIRTDDNSLILRQNPPLTKKMIGFKFIINPLIHLASSLGPIQFRSHSQSHSFSLHSESSLFCGDKPVVIWISDSTGFECCGRLSKLIALDVTIAVRDVPCAAADVAIIGSRRSPWQPIPRRVVPLPMSRTSSSAINGSYVSVTRDRSCGSSFSVYRTGTRGI